MAFATHIDMGTFLGRTLTDAENDQADLMLEIATAAVQRWSGQTIELVEDDDVTLVGNWGSKLVLPERPVIDITSVAIDDQAITLNSGYTWDGHQTLYRGRRTQSDLAIPWPVDPTIFWGGPNAQIDIVYSHGFDPIPADVKGVVLQMAARGMGTSPGVQSETLGPYSVTYGSSTAASTMTTDEMKQLRWLKQ